MSRTEVSAKLKDMADEDAVTVSYDFGDDLDSAVELFGADVVFQRFKAAATIDLQSLIRRHISGEKPKTQEEIQGIVDEWTPGVTTRTRKSPKEKVLSILEGLSEEERARLLAEL